MRKILCLSLLLRLPVWATPAASLPSSDSNRPAGTGTAATSVQAVPLEKLAEPVKGEISGFVEGDFNLPLNGSKPANTTVPNGATPGNTSAPAANGATTVNTTLAAPTMYVDRPSVSNTARVVGDGYVQVEQGFEFANFHGPATIFNAPLRLRVGTDDTTEFRLESPIVDFQGSQKGLADIIPGFKHVFYQSDALNLAVVGALEIPTGALAFRSPGVVPTFSITSDWVLADDWGMLINAFLSSPYNSLNQRILEPTGSFYISHALSPTVGMYTEFAAFGGPSSLGGLNNVGGAPLGASGTTLVDAGFNFMLDPTTQMDFAVFHGLTHGGFTWGGTVGFSHRW